MKLNICTWFCADDVGEESIYMQMRGKSSDPEFHAVYWRNIYIFYLSSKKVNLTSNHILFTNIIPPVVDGLNIKNALTELDVTIIEIPFEYRTPVGYYNAWRNQFFEFSILDHISNNYSQSNYWLILDSDCVFTKSVENLPAIASSHHGILTYKLQENPGTSINGLTQFQMQELYSELLYKPVLQLPDYYAGEFYFSNGAWVKRFSADFAQLWPILLERHSKGLARLTEEAHVLSFLYYKYNVSSTGTANTIIKRLWTQPFIYRNVEEGDDLFAIWHVPHEKRYGLKKIFYKIIKKDLQYWINIPNELFIEMLKYYLTIPIIQPKIYFFRLMPIQIARSIYYTFRKLFTN